MVVYVYFKNNYNMTETDSSKKQALDADPKAKQKKPNEILRWNRKSILNLFCFNIISIQNDTI